MMTSFALAVGLLAVTADFPPGMIGPVSESRIRTEMIEAPPPGGSSQAPAPPGSRSNTQSTDQANGGSGQCEECGGNDSCCKCKHRCRRRSSCNMLPHYAYISDWDFYYYLRPYNYIHVRPQQELVARWGGDVRNPYANDMFEKVYEGLEDSVRASMKKSPPLLPLPVSDRRGKTPGRTLPGSTGGFSR